MTSEYINPNLFLKYLVLFVILCALRVPSFPNNNVAIKCTGNNKGHKDCYKRMSS
jgi:hypothetical protein